MSCYFVDRGDSESLGQFIYAEISSIGELPNSEIGELKLLDNLSESLTYPLIQPYLFRKVEEYYCDNLKDSSHGKW